MWSIRQKIYCTVGEGWVLVRWFFFFFFFCRLTSSLPWSVSLYLRGMLKYAIWWTESEATWVVYCVETVDCSKGHKWFPLERFAASSPSDGNFQEALIVSLSGQEQWAYGRWKLSLYQHAIFREKDRKVAGTISVEHKQLLPQPSLPKVSCRSLSCSSLFITWLLTAAKRTQIELVWKFLSAIGVIAVQTEGSCSLKKPCPNSFATLWMPSKTADHTTILSFPLLWISSQNSLSLWNSSHQLQFSPVGPYPTLQIFCYGS